MLEHVRRIAQAGFARHHRIVELYDPSLPEVEGDRDRLVQVFLNLVKNAAEAAPSAGGQITLATQYQHGLRVAVTTAATRLELPITVEVRDNGTGVPTDMVDHLFEPFVSTKRSGSGPRPVAGGQDRGRPSRCGFLPAGRARRDLPGAPAGRPPAAGTGLRREVA